MNRWDTPRYTEPVYSEIPNYTNQPGAVAGVVCNQCLAVVQRANAEAHTDWHNQQRSMSVSNVKWCDAGDHPFKAGRPGSQSVMGTEIDDHGNAVNVAQDVCPECAAEQRKRRVVQALETVKPEECPVCEKNGLVYNEHARANQCLKCGWSSSQGSVETHDINSAYGRSAMRMRADNETGPRYMSDDRPEAG